MNNWLSILRFSALLSGILAELVPSLILEFKKRDKKELVVTKVTPAGHPDGGLAEPELIYNAKDGLPWSGPKPTTIPPI